MFAFDDDAKAEAPAGAGISSALLEAADGTPGGLSQQEFDSAFDWATEGAFNWADDDDSGSLDYHEASKLAGRIKILFIKLLQGLTRYRTLALVGAEVPLRGKL